MRKLLRKTQDLSGWLIFYTHDVQDPHSRYGCTPVLLEAAVKAALETSMKVMTVSEVLARANPNWWQTEPVALQSDTLKAMKKKL